MTPNIIDFDHLDTPGIEIFARLTEAQLRNQLEPEKGIFIAESPKVIAVALDEGYEPVALLTERRLVETQAEPIIDRIGDTPIFTGPTHLLKQLTGYELTRGVLCAMRRPKPRNVEDVCKGARRIAVLDGVVNATNTGAIFRAAAALGIDAILLTSTCSDPLNRRSVRVSMGTVFQIPWTFLAGAPDEWMGELRRQGFTCAAMALTDRSVSIDHPALASEPRLALLLGSEGDGLPLQVIEECDYVVRIPMQRGVDSLNVAAAAAVAFWQLR